ncbi:MAG: hypothetical protein DWC06_03085, partial [Candidatus Poseidoniales archaeon]
MAGPKTSAEKAREDAENAAADDMFGGAFDGLDGLTPPAEQEPVESQDETPDAESPEEITEEDSSESEESNDETPSPPSGPPS